MRFCGFILIFDNMSISQLEIDKSEWEAESGFRTWLRCGASEGTKHLSPPPVALTCLTLAPNVRLMKRLHPNHIHHSHSIAVQAVQTRALQALQAPVGGPASP